MRRTSLIPFAAAALALSAVPSMAQDAADPNVAAARAAIKGLGEGLRDKLMAAMQAGGPVNALGVCKLEAPTVTDAQSKASGMTVGRTALKFRGPGNAPDDFEKKVMEKFIADIKGGADPAKVEHAEVVEKDGKKTFRYMKPIMTVAAPCLACHGAEMKPEVSAKIKELYPNDTAVGFNAGDLRGAFTIKKAL